MGLAMAVFHVLEVPFVFPVIVEVTGWREEDEAGEKNGALSKRRACADSGEPNAC